MAGVRHTPKTLLASRYPIQPHLPVQHASVTLGRQGCASCCTRPLSMKLVQVLLHESVARRCQPPPLGRLHQVLQQPSSSGCSGSGQQAWYHYWGRVYYSSCSQVLAAGEGSMMRLSCVEYFQQQWLQTPNQQPSLNHLLIPLSHKTATAHDLKQPWVANTHRLLVPCPDPTPTHHANRPSG